MAGGHHIRTQFDHTYAVGGTTDVPLGEYLARPVLIASETWSVGTGLNTTFYPWDAFFKNPDIRKRVEGFRNVRGNLRIRAVVTGNPFLFGRLILAYHPWFDRDSMELGNKLQGATHVMLSQMPHIYIDAATSQGGEMTLPFFSPYNWIDTTRTDAFSELGIFHLTNFTQLRHANSSDGEMNVLFYAWLEDAEVCTPTSVDYDSVTYQNGMEADEHHSGLISKPASNVARAAGLLSKIPYIQPFALATEAFANTVAGVASIFGYSRPRVLDNICPMRELRYGELATTNQHEVMPKLAWDGKNQLSIDPRTTGLGGDDEMAITSIVTRESLLNTARWEETDPTDESLVEISVSPFYHRIDTSVTPARTALPPCTAMGRMFNFWRGSMVYRFSVVASAMHRGKLLVRYDPAGRDNGTVTNTYSRIIDISETRDFEVPVHWHAPTPWLRCWDTDIGDPAGNGGYSTATGSFDPETQNGVITLRVLTPLTSPDPSLSNQVQILFYARGGEDLEFAGSRFSPAGITYRSTNALVEPQNALPAGIEYQNAVESPVDDPVDPTASEAIPDVGDVPIPMVDHTNKVFMGESVQSLRAILKRYIVKTSLGSLSAYDTAPDTLRIRQNINNSTPMSELEFITHWFVGWRGSHRFRILSNDPGATIFASITAPPDLASTVDNTRGIQANQGVVEMEIPYYSKNRFSMARTSPTWVNYLDTDPTSPNNYNVALWSIPANVSGIPIRSVGEDFSLFFFLCVPVVYPT